MTQGLRQLRRLKGRLDNVRGHLETVLLTRREWDTVFDYVKDRSEIVTSLVFFIRSRNYIAAQTMSIRSLTDSDTGTDSLVTWLKSLAQNASMISKRDMEDFYLETFPTIQGTPLLSHVAFDSNYRIDPHPVQMEVDSLLQKADKVRTYADKYVAHADMNRNDYSPPDLGDLHDVIDSLDITFCKYELMLTGGDRHQGSAELIINRDWMSPYYQPWIKNQRT